MTATEAPLHIQLGMTDDELAAVVDELGREPTHLELAMYSVMWSEHCSYKSSRSHLGRLPTEAPWVLVGPGEGAGVIDVGDGLAVAIRIESHNHPSAVEPYQGAATGVGGIIRDIFSMGARPIAVMDPLRFGPLDDPRTRYLFEGVVSGISGYGNAVGVPTVGGEVVFDECYTGNPLVNVLCLGVLPKERLVLARAEGVGNLAVLMGSSTGRDGIGGASVLASAGFVEGSETKRPSVQVGDPFEEKKLIEACLALLDAGLAIGVQDLGAAGLSCAASETAAKTGAGMDVDVARVSKREPGMNPVELLTSESQERMLAIVTPENLDEVLALCERWEIRATVVGRVTDSARFRVFDGYFDAIGVPGTNPSPPLGDDAARGVLGPPAGRRRPDRQPGRRPALPPPARAAGRPRRAPGRGPVAGALQAVPARLRPLGRAARPARVAEHRGQELGLAPVRPPAVPQHGRRPGRRRERAAAQGDRRSRPRADQSPSTDSARARPSVSFSRSTAASPPGPATVLRNSWWSYWRQTQLLSAMFGDASRPRSSAERSLPGGNRCEELRRRVLGLAGVEVRGRRERAVVERPVAQAPDRDVRDRRAVRGHLRRLVAQRRARVRAGHADRVEVAVEDAEAGRVGHPADDRGTDLPALAEREHLVEVVGRHDRQHAFLALGREHLDRVHARLALRDPRGVDVHPRAGLRRGLGRGAGQSRGTEVLDPDRESRVEQREARLDQLLLFERVTDLHRRALGLGSFDEARGGEHARAPDAVPAGGRPHQHREVADAFGAGEHEALLRQDAEAEDVHQRVAGVALVEDDLAADRRHAHRVAVATDAAHDALEEVPRPGS